MIWARDITVRCWCRDEAAVLAILVAVTLITLGLALVELLTR